MGFPIDTTSMSLSSSSSKFAASSPFADPDYVITFDFGGAYTDGVLTNPSMLFLVNGSISASNTFGGSVTVTENYDDSNASLTLTSQTSFIFGMSAAQAENFGEGSFSFTVTATGATIDNDLITVNVLLCFAQGTEITTPTGKTNVEELQIGDLVACDDGHAVPVRWMGRQTVARADMNDANQPVRIKAGTLGNDRDLIVTADHGMIIDEFVINASALVNGDTIDFMPQSEMPEAITYYHVETDAHAVIFANGAPSETFLDMPGRQAFENYDEYLELYQFERIIPEMQMPRISSQRLVPDAIKARLSGSSQDAFSLFRLSA